MTYLRPKSPSILINDILDDLRDENNLLKTELSESQKLITSLKKFRDFLNENKCNFCLCHSNEKIIALEEEYNECQGCDHSDNSNPITSEEDLIEPNIVSYDMPMGLSIEVIEGSTDLQYNDANDSQGFAGSYGHEIEEEFRKIIEGNNRSKRSRTYGLKPMDVKQRLDQLVSREEFKDRMDGIEFTCNWEKCFKQFSLYSQYVRHYYSHCQYRPFKCPDCNKSFVQKANMKSHIQHKHKYSVNNCEVMSRGSRQQREPILYKCNWIGCGVQFKDYTSLRDHTSAHNGSQFNCTKCEQICDNESLLDQHMRENHSIRRQKLIGNTFKKKYGFVDKITKKYSFDRLNKRLCSDAIETDFINKTELKNKYVRNGSNYSCKWNDCMFQTKGWSHFRRHLLVHSDVKPYRCVKCDKSFRQKFFFISHLNAFHSEEEDVSKLVQIAATLPIELKLNDVLQSDDYEPTLPKDIPQKDIHTKSIANSMFVCTFSGCEASFKRKREWDTHQLKHRPEFTCTHNNCYFKTHLESVFNYHINKHNNR